MFSGFSRLIPTVAVGLSRIAVPHQISNSCGFLLSFAENSSVGRRVVNFGDCCLIVCQQFGVTETRRMGLHAFRHCNATELDRMGAPIKVRQDRLGHADSETTFGYAHAESSDHRRVAAELGRIFDPSLHEVSDAA